MQNPNRTPLVQNTRKYDSDFKRNAVLLTAEPRSLSWVIILGQDPVKWCRKSGHKVKSGYNAPRRYSHEEKGR
jgi:hypothetical protein